MYDFKQRLNSRGFAWMKSKELPINKPEIVGIGLCRRLSCITAVDKTRLTASTSTFIQNDWTTRKGYWETNRLARLIGYHVIGHKI